MRKKTLATVCFSIASIICGAWALGAPSGLNSIPTADVLDKGVIGLEIESDGRGRPWSGGCDRFLLLQAGLGGGVEVGIDHSVSESKEWWNVKWRPLDESPNRPAVALGLQSIRRGERAQPYVVFQKSLDSARFHTGAIIIDSKTRWLAGIDRSIGDRHAIQVDYTSGGENALTFGVSIGLTDDLSATVARVLGNSSASEDGYLVNLTWELNL